MPVLDRQLTGDNRGPAVMAIFEQLPQVAATVITERRQAPVVEKQYVGFGQGRHALHIPAIAFGERELLEEPGQPQLEDRPALTAGLMPQGARQPSFPDPGWPGDQHVVPIAYPLTRG
jgi:hypothetical protein